TLDLSTFVTNAEGTVSFKIKSGSDYATLEGSTLTSTANTGDVVITVNVTAKDVNNDGANEYNAYTGDGAITVTVVEKDNANVTVSGSANITKTYGEDSFKLSANVGNAGTGTGTWTWTTGDNNVAAVDNNGNVNIVGQGSTTITATYESNTTIGTDAFNLTVNKAALTVTANANSIVYGDAPAGNGVTYSGFVNGDTATVVTGTVGYTFNYEQYGNVGTYEITPNGLNAANYEITYVKGILTVTAKEVGLTWGESTFTYDGTSKAPTAEATGLVNNDAVTVTVTGGQTDAGTGYTAAANALSGAKAGNYTLPSANTKSFTISKAASSVSTAPSAAQNLKYTGNAQALVNAGTATGGEMVYSLTETGTYSKNIPTGTYAGSYTVYYKVLGDKNHKDTTPASVTATIGAADQNPTITAEANLAKGGNALDLSTFVTNAEGTVSFEIKTGTAATLEGSTLTSTANTGDVVITVNIAAKDLNSDGNAEYNAYTGDGAITVTVVDKTDANVTIDGEASITKTYGDASFTLTASAENKGDSNRIWNWTSNNTDVAAVNNGVVTIVGQGSATITAKYESNNTIGEASVTLTVNKKDVTITGLAAANKAYDGNTTATITGTAVVDGKVGSDDVSVVMGSAAFADKNAANGKTVNFTGFSLTGDKAANYNLKGQPASVIADITPKAVTITGVTAADKVYDGTAAAEITGTPTVDGKIGEDDVTVTAGSASFDNANAKSEKTVTFTGFALGGVDKDNYVLSAQPASVKANVTKSDRNLSVDKESVLLYPGADSADIVVTIANDADKSAVVSYEFESEIASASLNGKVLTVKSVDEGVTTLTIKAAETANYNAAEKTVSVKAVKEFISAITATAGADDKVAGQLEGDVIKIYGVKAAENAINVDVTVDSSFDKTVAGDTVTIKLKDSDTVVKTYTIDKSGVVVKAADVELEGKSEIDGTIAGVTFGNETKAENIVAAASKELNDIAKENKADGVTKVEVDLTITITPKSYDSENKTMTVGVIPTYVVKVTDNNGTTSQDAVELKSVTGKIKVSVKLPNGFAPTIAKLIHGEKDFEFVPVTVSEGVASWEQNRFSDVELIEGKTVSIGYTFFNEAEKTVPYKMTDIGSDLEADSRSGYTFNGWVITADGVKLSGKFKTLTEELFNALSAASEITAEPDFSVIYSGGGSGTYVPTVKTVEIKNSSKGTITADNESAKTGDIVTLTIAPSDGYVLKSISVKDENGNDVTVSRALMTAKFTMPEGKVTISAKYVKARGFDDVAAGSYYEDAVNWAVANGITNGVDNYHFAPDASCTRAQAVTFLWRALGSPEPTSTKSEFTDVTDANAFFFKAVLWATENGVTLGYDDGRFGVDDTVNRAQMVTFMERAMKGKATKTESFTDVPEGAYYVDAAAWAKENGVSTGIGDNKFGGEIDCLRAQIVTMLYRYFVK
ncbi:MAG: S-layer homology domain-containing protein, partial [Clostridia bacterium]|nr:S-layer homology domain-containing protein [Clostridia bacterium]